LRITLGLVVSVWLARYLGPNQFGTYSYALAFVTLFGALASLGLDEIVVREIVRQPERSQVLLGTTFTLKLIGGVVALILAVLTIQAIRPDDGMMFWFVAVIAGGLLFRSFDAIDCWYKSQVQSKYSVYAKSIAYILISCITIGLILLQAKFRAFAWMPTLEVVFGAIGLMIIYRQTGYTVHNWSISLCCARDLLKESWPLLLSAITVILYMKIDQVMLGEMVDDYTVGVYSAALRLSEVWYVLPVILMSSTLPAIIEAKKISKDVYYSKLQKLFDFLTWLSIGISFCVTYLGGTIVELLYGNQYTAAIDILIIHIWASVFVFLGVVSGQYLLVENLTRIAFYRTTFGAIVNIGLNLLLIPKYGGIGAAISTLISYFSANLATVFFKRAHGILPLYLNSFNILRLLPQKNRNIDA